MRQMTDDASKTGWHPLLWIGLVMLLSIPAFGMITSHEVDWTVGDFAAAAILLGGLGLGLELALRASRRWRLPLAFAALAIFLAIWIELAVGVFGTPIAGS